MSELETGAGVSEDTKRKARLPWWARLLILVGALLVVAVAVVAYVVFVGGMSVKPELIQDIVWHLESSDMTVDGETTPITVYPDTMGSVFASNGSHLSAQNENGWVYSPAGSWKITEGEGFTVNGSPVEARWKWKTLILEYKEGQLLKHVEYSQGEPFDIRVLAPGVWQGPADMWLWWYKFEGDTITLAEDGTCKIGTLSGTWAIDEFGTIRVDADVFEKPQPVFRIEGTNTLSLMDPETKHSLSLLDRIE